MRSKNKIKESVSALKDEHGKLSKSPKDAANLLANFLLQHLQTNQWDP